MIQKRHQFLRQIPDHHENLDDDHLCIESINCNKNTIVSIKNELLILIITQCDLPSVITGKSFGCEN